MLRLSRAMRIAAWRRKCRDVQDMRTAKGKSASRQQRCFFKPADQWPCFYMFVWFGLVWWVAQSGLHTRARCSDCGLERDLLAIRSSEPSNPKESKDKDTVTARKSCNTFWTCYLPIFCLALSRRLRLRHERARLGTVGISDLPGPAPGPKATTFFAYFLRSPRFPGVPNPAFLCASLSSGASCTNPCK